MARDECEQIGIELLLVCAGQSVGCTGIDLEGGIGDQLRGLQRRSLNRSIWSSSPCKISDSDDDIVWLCAARRREEGSDDDAFEWFAELHAAGMLLPSADDRLRDRAEEAIRLHRRLTAELFALIDRALPSTGIECAADLDEWLPCRVLVLEDDGVEEIWCGLSVRATDGVFIRPELRDILFASLEAHLAPAIFEARDDWPTGEVPWFETVRLGLR